MKKIFLILILLLITSGAYSQDTSWTPIQVKTNGRYTQARNANKIVWRAGDTTAINGVSADYVYDPHLKTDLNGNLEVSVKNQITSINYKDTLSATTLSATHLFLEQYQRVEVSVKYDSVAVGNDTLKLKHIGINGDTTTVYVLDTLTGVRQDYIVNVGDKKFHSFRIDKWCPYILIFKYSDAVIYTTKFILGIRGVKD